MFRWDVAISSNNKLRSMWIRNRNLNFEKKLSVWWREACRAFQGKTGTQLDERRNKTGWRRRTGYNSKMEVGRWHGTHQWWQTDKLTSDRYPKDLKKKNESIRMTKVQWSALCNFNFAFILTCRWDVGKFGRWGR